MRNVTETVERVAPLIEAVTSGAVGTSGAAYDGVWVSAQVLAVASNRLKWEGGCRRLQSAAVVSRWTNPK